MKRVYSAQNTLMVDHLKHVLDAQGIACAVQNRFVSCASGQLPPTDCWTELWVLDDARCAEASEVIAEAFDREDGSGGDVWVCTACGEQLAPQFEACWKCSTSRSAQREPDSVTSAVVTGPAGKGPRRSAQEIQVWVVLALMAAVAWYMAASFSGY